MILLVILEEARDRYACVLTKMSFADGSIYVEDLSILVDGLSVLVDVGKSHIIIVVLSGQGLTKGATHSESQCF